MTNAEDILKSLRQQGHWKVHLIPPDASARYEVPSEVQRAVARASVTLRGWDYPHIPYGHREDDGSYPVDGGWETWIDWDERHREAWRATLSGQFIHYFALWEDLEGRAARRMPSDETFLDLESAIYVFTEVCTFAHRYIGASREQWHLTVGLHNTSGRYLLGSGRRWLTGEYRALAPDIEVGSSIETGHSLDSLDELAIVLVRRLLSRFNFNLNERIAADIQQELTKRRP